MAGAAVWNNDLTVSIEERGWCDARTTTTASRGAAGSSVTRRGEANVARGDGSVGMSGWCGWEQESVGGWSKIKDFLEMVDNAGSDSGSIEKGSGATCIEDSSEAEIPMAKGEVTEKGNTFFKAKDSLRDVMVLSEEFGMDADVVDDLELGEVELVAAGLDGAAKDEAGGIIVVGEGVEVKFKSVKGAKKEEWVFVDNTEVMEGILDDVGVWFGGGEDNTKHVVYVWGIAGGLDADFLGGDEVHDCSLCWKESTCQSPLVPLV